MSDDGIEFLIKSCPELRVFAVDTRRPITGENWLDSIATHLPLAQCVVVSSRMNKPSPGVLEGANRARSLNQKLCVLLSWTMNRMDELPWRTNSAYQHPYNENVGITDDGGIEEVLGVLPRLSDLKARRVRSPDVLLDFARRRLAKNDALAQLRDVRSGLGDVPCG